MQAPSLTLGMLASWLHRLTPAARDEDIEALLGPDAVEEARQVMRALVTTGRPSADGPAGDRHVGAVHPLDGAKQDSRALLEDVLHRGLEPRLG